MSPKWLITLGYLLLVLGVGHMRSQIIFIKTAYCVLWSTAFVSASCAPCERFLCRILASRIKQFCKTFPCTNYGSPSSYKCTSVPFGCLPWRVKAMGLCEPFKICCDPKSGADSKAIRHYRISQVKKKRRNTQLKKKDILPGYSSAFINNLISQKSVTDKLYEEINGRMSEPEEELLYLKYLRNQTENDVTNNDRFQLPHSPEKYLEDWLEKIDDEDSKKVEIMIKKHYEKYIKEVNAINEDERKHGKEAFRIPNFEEFRSVALGQTSIEQ